MKDQLTARYQNYSVSELLEVLENKAEYTPLAIEVAESEWDNRRITQEEFNRAKEELEKKKLAESLQQHPLTVIGRKTGNFLAQVYHDINPTTRKTPQKAIILICGFVALNLLYYLISDFGFLLYMLQHTNYWDFTTGLYFLPFIFLPGTIYYFYKKSPVGWTMLSIWLTYIVLSAVYACLYELALPVTFEFNDDSGIMGLLNEISPRRGLSHYFFSLLIFGGMLYYINTTAIKHIFRLNKWHPIASIGLTALVVTVQWIPLLF